MGTLFRTGKGRNQYTNCSDAPVAFRVYIFKSESMRNSEDNGEWDDGPPEYIKEEINAAIKDTVNEVENVLLKDGQENTSPTRIYVYYDLEDFYYSIAYGYKYKNSITPIANLKYAIASRLYCVDVCAFHIVGSNCHLASAIWDTDHCQSGPLYYFENDTVDKLIKGFVTPKAISKSKKKTIIVQDEDKPVKKKTRGGFVIQYPPTKRDLSKNNNSEDDLEVLNEKDPQDEGDS
jgi:hypothetical protein